MITPYQENSQPKFVSRIFSDCNGRQFRLVFLVAIVGGELRGRLVSATLISSSVARLNGAVQGGIFCLPITCSDTAPSTVYVPAYVPVISPYFSRDFLITSQPTRAPSHS